MLEFFKQPGVYEASLFFAGILINKLINMYRYYRQVGDSAFNILLSTYVMALGTLDLKEKHLSDAGVDEKQIKNILELDKKDIDQWRDLSFQHLYNFSPKIFGEIKEHYDKES